ncbi:MAG: hypothetical protein CUN56_08540 [Phototrophicales bacterium]|nr:MAG: hypothetical protein CUN56_08540 [Phototrophicales bacterium]RMG72165.1 MAG: hypothetical protein D6711_13510 [Chloroflexota bacterium]
MTAYDQILDFLTSAPSLQDIVAFELSPETKERVAYLDLAKLQGLLTADEEAELDEFNRAMHFMEMIQARARRRLGIWD